MGDDDDDGGEYDNYDADKDCVDDGVKEVLRRYRNQEMLPKYGTLLLGKCSTLLVNNGRLLLKYGQTNCTLFFVYSLIAHYRSRIFFFLDCVVKPNKSTRVKLAPLLIHYVT